MLNSQKGSALVLVLVVSSLLLASSFWAVSTYTAGVRATEQLMEKFEARLSAESALQILKYYGATGLFESSTLSNTLPDSVDFPEIIPLTGETFTVMIGNSLLHLSLLDSAAILNTTYMESKLLNEVLYYFGVEDEKRFVIRDSLDDWMDKNDFHHVNGAESYYYRHKGVAYAPRNSMSMQSVWEMSLLRGMDETIWNEIRPFLAQVPALGQNIQTMDTVMLAAYFGLNTSQAEQLVELRKDLGYLTIAAIEDITGQKYEDSYSGLGSFPSRILQIHITAESGTSREQWLGWITYISDRQGPYRILAWQEGTGD